MEDHHENLTEEPLNPITGSSSGPVVGYGNFSAEALTSSSSSSPSSEHFESFSFGNNDLSTTAWIVLASALACIFTIALLVRAAYIKCSIWLDRRSFYAVSTACREITDSFEMTDTSDVRGIVDQKKVSVGFVVGKKGRKKRRAPKMLKRLSSKSGKQNGMSSGGGHYIPPPDDDVVSPIEEESTIRVIDPRSPSQAGLLSPSSGRPGDDIGALV